jgi:hypothetical protein
MSRQFLGHFALKYLRFMYFTKIKKSLFQPCIGIGNIIVFISRFNALWIVDARINIYEVYTNKQSRNDFLLMLSLTPFIGLSFGPILGYRYSISTLKVFFNERVIYVAYIVF